MTFPLVSLSGQEGKSLSVMSPVVKQGILMIITMSPVLGYFCFVSFPFEYAVRECLFQVM